MAHTTRARPAPTMASAHGGVTPWCEHGSSVTYMVAPRARVAGARDGLGLGVRAPARRRPAARDDLARALIGDDGADGRVGGRAAQPARRDAQRDLHHLGVEIGALRGAHHTQCFLSGAVSATELSKAMCVASCTAAGSAAISPSTSWKSDASRKSR